MLFDTLALISLLIVITLLRRLVSIFPSLVACVVRWKENISIDSSLKLRRDRDLLAMAMIIPFCLIVFHFGLYPPAARFSGNAALGVTTGAFVAYILIRTLSAKALSGSRTDRNVYHAAVSCSGTFFIILTLCLLALGGTLSFIGVSQNVIRHSMIWLSGATYLIFLIRKTQIFLSSCSLFTAFLYLCALEILPTGALVASAVIFRL